MIPNRATHQIFVIPKAVDTPLNSTLIPAISQCFLCLLSAPANMINDSNSRMTKLQITLPDKETLNSYAMCVMTLMP